MFILALWLGGCAARAEHVQVRPAAPEPAIAQISGRVTALEAPTADFAAPAAALVFSPAETFPPYLLNLDRERRERVAVAGFEQRVTTYTFVRIDDRQTQDYRERYDRRAVSESVGVSYR